MGYIFLYLLLILLGILAFQDFKNREISWYLIPALLIGFIINVFFKELDVFSWLLYTAINLLIILLNLLGVTVIISMKEKKITNIINQYLGLGDVLFFLIITPLFSPINFIFFYIGSVLIITLVYGFVILLNNQKNTLIPLAGAMSFLLMLVLLLDQYLPEFNLYQDFIIQ